VSWLADDPRVVTAARLGDAFGTNPLVLLDVDEESWLILHACATVLTRDNEQAERASKSN